MAQAQVNNKLPDGRTIRALEGTYIQRRMFTLHLSSLFVPAQEGIMTVKDLDQAIQSGAYRSVNVNNWWRTSEYGFYPKGFEKEDIPLGNKLLYVENGISHTLEVPDVPVKINGETIGLRQAIGMGVIPIGKLQIQEVYERTFTVTVKTDFDPATDVKVVDIMRPRGWALVDENGYPLKSKPSNQDVPDALYSYIRYDTEFDAGSTGWHGSLLRYVGDVSDRRVVGAYTYWSFVSGVALVGRSAAAPQVEVHGEKLKVTNPSDLRMHAEQLESASAELAKRFEGCEATEMYTRLVVNPLETARMLRELADTIEAARG